MLLNVAYVFFVTRVYISMGQFLQKCVPNCELLLRISELNIFLWSTVFCFIFNSKGYNILLIYWPIGEVFGIPILA